jgi:hypothetical protein
LACAATVPMVSQPMTETDLQRIADAVVERARQQGFVVPREVREELTRAGLSDTLWKDVLALARASLSYRRNRYYYVPAVSDRVRQEQQQQEGLHQAVRQLIEHYRSIPTPVERREQDRIDFVQPVKVQTEDGHEFTLLSRDLSPTGIRLVGTRRLLGHKLRVRLPGNSAHGPWCFLVRVLWTCALGEDLFENGGEFLEAVAEESNN